MRVVTDKGEFKVIGKNKMGEIVAETAEGLPKIIIPAEVKKVIFESLWEMFTGWIKQLLKIK